MNNIEKKGYIFIDPMSYNNLQEYDDRLIKNINLDRRMCFMNNKYTGELKKDLFKIYDYSDKNFIIKNISYIKSQIYLLNWIINNEKYYKLVHFQWLKNPYIDWILIKLIKKKTKLKVIYTAHNVLPHDTGNKYYSIFKKIYLEVDKLIVHTINTKSTIMEKFGIENEKIKIVPHGKLGKEHYKISNNHLSKERITLLFIGEIRENKGIDILINSWNDKLDLKYNLIIAGRAKDEIKNMLKKLQKFKNVKLDIRFLEDEEFEKYIINSDIILLPYREISQSGVLMSAINYRKHVIISDRGGLKDIFEFGDFGWIMDKVNEDELNRILDNINVEQLNEKERNTLKWDCLDEYYSWENIGKKTSYIYNNV